MEDVLALVAALFDKHGSLTDVRLLFVSRTADADFIEIAELALLAKPQKNPPKDHGLVWLGYEITIDAKQLKEDFR